MINALGDSTEGIAHRWRTGETDTLSWEVGCVPDRALLVGSIELDLPPLPEAFRLYDCRNSRLLLAAYEQIRGTVERFKTTCDPERIGVVLGSSTAGISDGELALAKQQEASVFDRDYHYLKQEIGSVAECLAQLAQVKGPAITVSTACSSSAKSFSSARSFLEMDLCDAVLVGGCDTLCGVTLKGFHALEAITTTTCNPMSRNRDGFAIGEAAALFLMTREPGPVSLLGVGESSDAYHISAPEPSGLGAEEAMRAALKDAGLEPANVDYINLHGTATPQNDAMESQAIARVFGSKLPCSSTKPWVGHTLGAAGATEIAFCWQVCVDTNKHVTLPHHTWDGAEDPALPDLTLVKLGDTLDSDAKRVCLSNSFAFGGSNCSVIVACQDAQV